MTTIADSVFGKVHLGYVVIETEKFADWRRFGRDAVGMAISDRGDADAGGAVGD